MVRMQDALRVLADFSAPLNLPNDVQISVFGHWKEITGESGSYGGIYRPGARPGDRTEVAVACYNHSTAEALLRTLRHEVQGHYLINTLTPEQKANVLSQIIDMQSEPSMQPLWDEVSGAYADQGITVQAEEVFANIAQDVDASLPRDLRPAATDRDITPKERIAGFIHDQCDRISTGLAKTQIFYVNDVHPKLSADPAEFERRASAKEGASLDGSRRVASVSLGMN
ncbi:hypothetical protein A3709_19840 [Halioglobus sp. HI00S01]|uniref:hypothetical protein n=1 Tax=Halioglobus sp. HI00S01 TaxID=1822214 RepID=UPI0007C3BCE0|nr:hypothetical protein [Halioglobus sp. HI00S01]KZX57877.1 hypothetical protein A3709_19840 [Halioglobus sp. HI00S01]